MAPTMYSRSSAPAYMEFFELDKDVPGSTLLPYDAWLHVRTAMRLSERELRIVQAVFDDVEQDQIARDLDVAPDFVYRSLQRIYVKLRIGSRAELIVRVMSEYVSFVADQEQPEMDGLSCWPVKLKSQAKTA